MDGKLLEKMIKRLWITEKPSAARDLAAGICLAHQLTISNQSTSGRDGYIKLSNGEVIAPLQGHMIQAKFLSDKHRAAKPETFFDFLPIVVKDFEYEPRYEYGKNGEVKTAGGKPVPMRQYVVVTDLIRKADTIVNAGDIDREGQLIVDELLRHCGIDPARQKNPIWRLPLVSARAEDIRPQVLNLVEKNCDPKWVRKGQAALARQYCDAAVGFNGSMAYQAATGYRRTSVGRVQTPVLCIIVDREAEIVQFKPKNYFVPIITMADGTEMRFYKRHDAAGQPGFDSEGRITDEAVAKRMCQIIGSGLAGRINLSEQVKGKENPPLPFSATVLASTVSKRTGMLPTQVEAVAKTLRDKHHSVTYVGTDCRFLNTSSLEDAGNTMKALSRFYPRQANGANMNLRSAAWNDSKVQEHGAIIPTDTPPVNPTPEEKAVYDAIAARYVCQFYPAHEFVTNRIGATFGKDEFRASRKETTRMGWKEVEGDMEQGGPGSEDVKDQDLEEVEVRHRPGETQ